MRLNKEDAGTGQVSHRTTTVETVGAGRQAPPVWLAKLDGVIQPTFNVDFDVASATLPHVWKILQI